ncbi:MAG: hypothetical protein Q8Q09_28985 [Deltaproteobacteria bacterium]|nr:hypothetical protein [Deltaproteobacteria bacterium]
MVSLRTFSYIDVLQPQVVGFLQTVSAGFQPLDGMAALFVEIAPGIAINTLTDAALKHASVYPGMQIVERAYGLLELHAFDQGAVRAAGEAILQRAGLQESDRLAPSIISSEIIHGIDGHQAMLINRMRHGDMIRQGETLYVLEVLPAGYAALACNEAEKAADIRVLEMITFGAFGRLYLSGSEEHIAQAAAAAERALKSVSGRVESKRA